MVIQKKAQCLCATRTHSCVVALLKAPPSITSPGCW